MARSLQTAVPIMGCPASQEQGIRQLVDSRTPFLQIRQHASNVRPSLRDVRPLGHRVNFHPLHNAASTTLRSSDLLRFIRALGYEPTIVRLPAASPDP